MAGKSSARMNGGDGISDAAVEAKTGKSWAQWFTLLDRNRAGSMSHQEIAAWLHEQQTLSPWWSQMVTVEYERSRGRRVKHERPGGFSVSVSRTLPHSAAALFRAFAEARERARWLPDPDLVIRKATPEKTLRITWVDGATSVEVGLFSKGDGKCQVVVQHDKLADAAAADRMKAYWADALGQLRAVLSRA